MGNLKFYKTMLFLLVPAFVLSPKIILSAGTGIFLRADDIIITCVVVYWLVNSRHGLKLPETRLDIPIFMYFTAVILTGIFGILRGTAVNSFLPVFYVLKMAEYAVGFYCAVAIVKSGEDAGMLIDIFPATAGVVCIIGICEWLWAYHTGLVESADQWYRIFNNAVYTNDANHMAGFLMISAVLVFCRLFMSGASPWCRTYTFLGFIAIIATIGLTLSRAGMIAACVACLCAAFFLPVRKAVFAAAIAFCALLVPVSDYVLSHGRGGVMFEYEDYMKSRGNLEDGYWQEYSATRNRFDVWDALVKENMKFPVSGAGIGSRGRYAYESQYFYMFGETGLMGLAVFLYLLWKIWKEARRRVRSPESGVCSLESAYSYIFPAFVGITAGMVIMSFTSEAFLITRIAGPFWILAGIAVSMPERGENIA